MRIRVDPLCRLAGVIALLLLELWAPAGAAGQEPIVPLQLSFSDPGARSMGLGGAFVALADDATAALANPAGLVQLTRPEVSIEGRHWSYSTPYTVGGRVENLPSGIGIDTTVGLRTARSEESLNGLSFLSLVYPVGKWSFALFRHQLADFEFRSETQGLFGGGSQCCQVRILDQRARTVADFRSFGVAGAYRVNASLALGLGAIRHDATLDSAATMYLPDETPDGLLGPTSFLPERSLATERNFVGGTDWALTGGVLWKVTRGWSLGGVYRQGAELELGAERTAGEAGDSGVPPGGVIFSFGGLPVDLPGLVGLGFAYRAPNERVTITFQWDRIDYSSIVESLPLEDQAIDDADELHLGGEYFFVGSRPPLALRLGVWLDPDHQLRSTSDDPFLGALLPRGDDDLHYTAGVGLAWRSFQLDLGVDLADRVDAASLSVIYTF